MRVTPFPAAQLGKDLIGSITSGVADMGMVVVAYQPDKLPLASVAELPGTYNNSCEAAGKLWAIVQPGGPLYEKEFQPLGLRPLFASVLPNYKILTTSKPVRTVEDLAGLKLRANGAAMGAAARAMGAIPIQVQVQDMYDALNRGTIDGALFPYHAGPPYDLDQLFKYGIEGPALGSTAVVISISEKKWETLSDAAKAALETAAMEVQPYFCQWMEDDETSALNGMIEKNGFQRVTITEAEMGPFQERLITVPNEWAERVDAQKMPGTEILKAFREAEPVGVTLAKP